MDQVKTDTLLREFPLLYNQYYLPMTETCMCWGFDCGDGWYNIIYDLSKELERHVDRKWYERLLGVQLLKVSRLWNNLLHKIFKLTKLNLSRLYWNCYPFAAVQVKEKFGTLCFYTNHYNEKLQEIINKYERLSAHTCEQCGEYGTLIRRGWWHVTCESCASESDLDYIHNAPSLEDEDFEQ